MEQLLASFLPTSLYEAMFGTEHVFPDIKKILQVPRTAGIELKLGAEAGCSPGCFCLIFQPPGPWLGAWVLKIATVQVSRLWKWSVLQSSSYYKMIPVPSWESQFRSQNSNGQLSLRWRGEGGEGSISQPWNIVFMRTFVNAKWYLLYTMC